MIEIITPGVVGLVLLYVFMRVRTAIREVLEDDKFESNHDT